MIIYNRFKLKEPVLLRLQGPTAHAHGHLQTKQNRFFKFLINECARWEKAKILKFLNDIKM